MTGYLPGSKERKDLESALQTAASTVEDVPIVIGDEEIRTKNVKYQVMVSTSINLCLACLPIFEAVIMSLSLSYSPTTIQKRLLSITMQPQ